jgi:hypothetical protein
MTDDPMGDYGGFVSQQDLLKAGKWKCDDLNFIAQQNAYMFEELRTIRFDLAALRREAEGSYAGFLILIVIFLGIQIWLLYVLAVKLGAILPGWPIR